MKGCNTMRGCLSKLCCFKAQSHDDEGGFNLGSLPAIRRYPNIPRDDEDELAARMGGITGPVIQPKVSEGRGQVDDAAPAAAAATNTTTGEASTSGAGEGPAGEGPPAAEGPAGASSTERALPLLPMEAPLPALPVSDPVEAYVNRANLITESCSMQFREKEKINNAKFVAYLAEQKARREAAKEKQRKNLAMYVEKSQSSPAMFEAYQRGERETREQRAGGGLENIAEGSVSGGFTAQQERLEAFGRFRSLSRKDYIKDLHPKFEQWMKRFEKMLAWLNERGDSDSDSDSSGARPGSFAKGVLIALAGIEIETDVDEPTTSAAGGATAAAAEAAEAARKRKRKSVWKPLVLHPWYVEQDLHRKSAAQVNADYAAYAGRLRAQLHNYVPVLMEEEKDADTLMKLILSLDAPAIENCIEDNHFCDERVIEYIQKRLEFKLVAARLPGPTEKEKID
ncbi:hypothetical protein F4779DRAFT_415265 [Xylariaceae sp. FL0662B]|nr:hypothetical protein F4779DRAFT_415265 [Xylariaceae sp. FL0662B]